MAAATVIADEGYDAGCRLTHVRAAMLGVLASCIYRLEMISPCQAKKPIWLRVTARVDLLVVVMKRGRLPPAANSPTT